MPATLSTKKKSNKLLELIHNYQPERSNNSFLRSYSQLLNKHFSQSHKQKSSLRKSLSTSNTFRTKKNKKSPKKNKQLPKGFNQADPKKTNNFNESIDFVQNQETLEKSLHQNTMDPEMLGSKISRQKLLELNPQSNLKLQKILMSKTRMLQKNSHQNVLLNQKLHQSAHEKKSLMSLLQSLRMEILKEKKMKAKVSTNMGKLMNKIEEVNTGIRKTEEEIFYAQKQTKFLQKDLNIQNRKKQQLETISEMNNQKIQIQKELINSLCKDLERNKAIFFQTKTHLNEIKQIYMRETKCLVKVEMHKQQSEQEMNLIYKTVEQSAINAKQIPKN